MKKTRAEKIKKIFFTGSLFFILSPTLVSAICCNCHAASEPTKNICLTGDYDTCANLKSSNSNLANYTCDSTPLTTQCQKIVASNASAICFNTPATASTYIPTESTPSALSKTIATPKLEIKIPGLQFQETVDVTGGKAYQPFLAQYISAVYNYAVGISVIATTVAIVYGGFLYIVGSAATSVSRGKEWIINALIGLFLILGMHTILSTLNPKLVEMSVLGVNIVSRQGAFDDPSMEAERVREAATVSGESTSEDEVEIIDLSVGPQPPAPTAPVQPTVTPPPPGTVVRNSKGEFVAQGSCPEDMKKIPYSEQYEKVMRQKIKSFCMDTYEAPNQPGVYPYNGVNDWEADWYCKEHGKRLCWNMEWQRACLGPNGDRLFSYGSNYVEGKQITAGKSLESGQAWLTIPKPENPQAPCNYDSDPGSRKNLTIAEKILLNPQDDILIVTYIIPFKPETSLLNPLNPLFISNDRAKGANNVTKKDPATNAPYIWKAAFDYLKLYLERISGAEPSGKRATCQSAEGVFDLTANVQEITVSAAGKDKTAEQRIAMGPITGDSKPYAWVGFYWNPVAHHYNSNLLPDCFNTDWAKTAHAAGTRAMENGFRCCLDFQEPAN
ncbi:MAG: pilin [Patescibacteria group bacterium]